MARIGVGDRSAAGGRAQPRRAVAALRPLGARSGRDDRRGRRSSSSSRSPPATPRPPRDAHRSDARAEVRVERLRFRSSEFGLNFRSSVFGFGLDSNLKSELCNLKCYDPPMRIAIVGSGGVGGYFGGRLAAAGRGRHLSRSRRAPGRRCAHAACASSVRRVTRTSPRQRQGDPAAIRAADVVLFAVKLYSAGAALTCCRRSSAPGAPDRSSFRSRTASNGRTSLACCRRGARRRRHVLCVGGHRRARGHQTHRDGSPDVRQPDPVRTLAQRVEGRLLEDARGLPPRRFSIDPQPDDIPSRSGRSSCACRSSAAHDRHPRPIGVTSTIRSC